ncbi:MAG TPA: aldehyde dehydrogenase family protein [Kiloniellaceae bacterium]|nr:aldehyde dehydrogenase family protein [Kiloniellaceae bacterium]
MVQNNLIAGSWVEGSDAVDNINPSDLDDVIDSYARADAGQVNDAVAAAKAAFPGWSTGSIQARAGMLAAVAAEIMARKEELGELLAREEGKTKPEGIGEVMRAGQIFDFFAGEVVRQSGEKIASVRPGIDVEIPREPLGVVGLITPWNFPIAIPAWKIAPALAYGNCVVIKPAEIAPASVHALAEIIQRAGVPEGVFNLVMGKGSVVGEALVNHPDVAAISFTGSVETGKRIAANCAARLAKVQLEMGGKNPLVVLDDADLGTAVDCALNGAFFSTGQRCTASSRLVVQKGIHNAFVDALVEKMQALKVDNALLEGTQMGPVVDQSQLDQDLKYLDIGRDEGAKLAWGGERLNRATQGFYLQPALFTETDNAMRINQEEIFGPIASVIAVDDYDQALHVANDTAFGLSSGICTASLKHASHFKRHAQAGMVMVNLPTAGVDYHVPFGGRKGSSYGSREQGRYAAEFYTTVKTGYTLPV